MLGNINDVFNFFTFLLNKTQSGSISGGDFSLAINVAQQQYFRLKLGLPELYTVEKRQAPQEIQVTQNINDAMRQFITQVTLQGNTGVFTLPANFAAFVPSGYLYVTQTGNLGTNVTPQPIDFVTLGELGFRQNNYVTFPSLEYPLGTYFNGQLQIYPGTINSIYLNYYRYPKTPVYAFTVNNNDQIIYDATNSVQLEFSNLDWENICHIAVKYYSQTLREEFMYQTEDKRIATGS